jgi:7-cyano-7-deazaguanine synthase
VSALTIDYDQRHRIEIKSAMMVANIAGIERHEIVRLGDVLAGRSPLTDPEETLEQYEDHDTMEAIIGKRVEKTFVPMRNALFLTLAANRAVCMDASVIVTGVCQADNANYPDCRRSFIDVQEETINEALGFTVPTDPRYTTIRTPLMDMSKSDSINLAASLPGCYSALAFSHTAYDGQYPPTGKDHASILRAHGFYQADLPDPLVLRAVKEGLMPAPKSDNYRTSLVLNALHYIAVEVEKFPDNVKHHFGWVSR